MDENLIKNSCVALVQVNDKKKGRHYTLGEKKMVSVTEVLGCFVPKQLMEWFKRTSPEEIELRSSSRATLGTVLHQDLFSATPSEHATAVLSLLKSKNIEITCAEIPVCDPDLGYAGTCDIVGKRNGRDVVVELKTGRNYSSTAMIQVVAYAKALERAGMISADFEVAHVWAPPGKEPKLYDITRIESVWGSFLAMLEVYRMLEWNNLEGFVLQFANLNGARKE